MVKLFCLSFIYLIPFLIFGQNLIPNPGFEQCVQCDGSGRKELGINLGANDPIDWNAATYGTPDFVSITPHSGKKHGGFFVGFPKFEYLTNHFTECLKPGAVYQFSFWISADTRNPNYIVDEIGVYIQQGPAAYLQTAPLNQLTPTFQTNDGDFITKSAYRQFSFTYTANGGEDYFIVGRFHSLGIGDTTFVGTKRPANSANEPVYYFVDDFEMIQISPDPIVDLIPDDEINLCPDDKKQIGIKHLINQDSVRWSTNETTDSIEVTSLNSGYIYVTVYINGSCKSIFFDSILISLKDKPQVKIKGDEVICIGDSVKLTAICDSCFNFVWNTKNIGNTLTVKKAGNYSVTASTSCGITTDIHKIDSLNFPLDSLIRFPNIFAPKGDLVNQNFHPWISPTRTDSIVTLKFAVYNRWGQKVFETSDKEGKWTTDANDPMDTYMYMCELEYKDCNGRKKKSFKGTVTLIR